MKVLIGFVILLMTQTLMGAGITPAGKVERFVNIRSAPDSGAEIVGRLNRGETLPFVAQLDDWYQVELPDGGEGYVHADWSDLLDEPSAVATEAAVEERTDAIDPPEPGMEMPQPDAIATDDADIDTAIDAVAAATKEESVDVPQLAPDAVIVTESPVIADTELEEEPPEPKVEPTPVVEPVVSASYLKGQKDFLVRFRTESTGTSSQIYDDGNVVGIGTTSPRQRLEVNGSIQVHDQNSGVAGLMITQSSGETGYILHNRASTLTIGAGSVDRMTIDRNGNVGVMVARPAHPLEMASGAHVTAGGVWTNSSSRYLKEDIEVLDAYTAATALAELEPVSFRYRDDGGDRYLGFIAEDVPDIVATPDRRSLSPMDIVALLTKVVQEQQRRIADLEMRLEKNAE